MHEKFATGRMRHMQRKHGLRGQRQSRAYSISHAARVFEKNRSTLHRWIFAGVLLKCNASGVYETTGDFVWGCDMVKMITNEKRKQGSPLKIKKSARPSKWQLQKSDPERTYFAQGGLRQTSQSPDDVVSMARNLVGCLYKRFSLRQRETLLTLLRDGLRVLEAGHIEPITKPLA